MIKAMREFRKKTTPFLLLEIGLLSARLHCIEPNLKPIRIRQLGETPLEPGDFNSMLTALNRLLAPDLPCREIAIVIVSPSIHHQLVTLPPMKGSQREVVLRRELKRFETPLEEQEQLSFYSFGRWQEEDRLIEPILCAQIPKGLVQSILKTLRAKELHPIGFTSHAQMVCHLMREKLFSPGENTALVEVNSLEGCISLFRRGIWGMERRFLVGRSAVDSAEAMSDQASGEMDEEKLLLEIGRTLQYFKQQYRNENISQIFLYGSTPRVEAVKALLSSAFSIPISLVVAAPDRFDIQAGPAEKRDGGPVLFNIPAVASLHSRFEKYIDFLPKETRAQPTQIKRSYLLAAAVIFFYGILGLIWFLVRQEADQLDRHAAAALPANAGLSRPETHFQKLLEMRSQALGFLRASQWLDQKHHALGQLVRSLADMAPRELTITSFEAQEKSGGWQVNLRAEIAAPNGSLSQQLLQSFQSRLRQLSSLQPFQFSDIEIIDLETGEPGISSNRKNHLTFSLRGLLSYATPRV